MQEKINTELAKENSVLQSALTKVTEEKDLLKEAIKQRDNLCAGGGQEDGNFDDQVIDLIYKQIQQDDHANKECDTRHIDALFTVSALLLILYKKHNQTLILIAGLITFGFLVAKIKTNLPKKYQIPPKNLNGGFPPPRFKSLVLTLFMTPP